MFLSCGILLLQVFSCYFCTSKMADRNFVPSCCPVLVTLHKATLCKDGPTVNWKLFEDLQADLQHETGKNMMNIESCSLHMVRGAF